MHFKESSSRYGVKVDRQIHPGHITSPSPQPVQLVEGIRGVLALNKTTESMLTDLKNQEFSLGDEEINQLRQTVKGECGTRCTDIYLLVTSKCSE